MPSITQQTKNLILAELAQTPEPKLPIWFYPWSAAAFGDDAIEIACVDRFRSVGVALGDFAGRKWDETATRISIAADQWWDGPHSRPLAAGRLALTWTPWGHVSKETPLDTLDVGSCIEDERSQVHLSFCGVRNAIMQAAQMTSLSAVNLQVAVLIDVEHLRSAWHAIPNADADRQVKWDANLAALYREQERLVRTYLPGARIIQYGLGDLNYSPTKGWRPVKYYPHAFASESRGPLTAVGYYEWDKAGLDKSGLSMRCDRIVQSIRRAAAYAWPATEIVPHHTFAGSFRDGVFVDHAEGDFECVREYARFLVGQKGRITELVEWPGLFSSRGAPEGADAAAINAAWVHQFRMRRALCEGMQEGTKQ